MPEYCFFKKDRQCVALQKSESDRALQLIKQGYEKQFEEVSATDEKQAISRFSDIRREQKIDQHNFLAGAGSMPWIGILTAAATCLFRKK